MKAGRAMIFCLVMILCCTYSAPGAQAAGLGAAGSDAVTKTTAWLAQPLTDIPQAHRLLLQSKPNKPKDPKPNSDYFKVMADKKYQKKAETPAP